MEFDGIGAVVIGTIIAGLIGLVAFMALPQPEKKTRSTGGGSLKPRGGPSTVEHRATFTPDRLMRSIRATQRTCMPNEVAGSTGARARLSRQEARGDKDCGLSPGVVARELLHPRLWSERLVSARSAGSESRHSRDRGVEGTWRGVARWHHEPRPHSKYTGCGLARAVRVRRAPSHAAVLDSASALGEMWWRVHVHNFCTLA